MSPSKKCAVCGDKALGYNFNAVTCESCKAFFRRNALAKKQFTCPFNQACEITVVTRRFCQRCRLKKCLEIGMKSENIMSEEDKMIKRRKIETNREKRRVNGDQKDEEEPELDAEEPEAATNGTVSLGHEIAKDSTGGDGGNSSLDTDRRPLKQTEQADSSGFDASYDSQHSFGSFDSGTGLASSSGQAAVRSVTSTSTLLSNDEVSREINPASMSGEEMVEFIVCDPDRACQAISKLMRTPSEAMTSLEKILSSQKDALRLIEHLIAYPGDALKIISKIMNSPFNALSVFTKFMSSPTDALEIISKIVSSPQDVLQFIQNLMDSPENAIDIMNKFMNTPAEALRIINKIFNASTNGAPPAASSTPNKRLLPNEPIGDSLIGGEVCGSGEEQKTQQAVTELPGPYEHSLLGMLSSSSSPSKSPSTSYVSTDHLQASTATSFRSDGLPRMEGRCCPLVANSLTPQEPTLSHPSPELAKASSDVNTSAASWASPALSNEINELASEYSDLKNAAFGESPLITDSINSLDSVLSEVIRIEFQAFNELPPEPRIKQEYHYQSLNPAMSANILQQHTNSSIPMNAAAPYYACNSAAHGMREPHHHQAHHHQLSQQHHQQHHMQQKPAPALQQPSSMPLGRELNDMEQLKLHELKLASEALYYPVDDDLTTLMVGDSRIKPEDTNQDPKLLQVINLTAVAIKRLIKMAKKISAFREMCQEDQVALLKGGCTEMMIMRSVMSYDGNRNTWKIPHTKEDMSNIRAEILKLAKGNVYEEHLKFIRTFDEKWRMDENIILIMCAIVLFMPTRLRIIHSDVIRLEQNSYYYLLRRYLESVYTGCEARSAFIKLIQKISDVERLNQFIIGVYLNVNPSQVEPLLREIFDMKNH